MGNKFSQGLHDCGTISDKRKRLAIGIQFIDMEWEMNHVICLGMSALRDGVAQTTVGLLQSLSRERMGADFSETVACLTQDKAAAAVARAMDYEVDHCDMHQSSKISVSAVGVLVRTRQGKSVNPFKEGTQVMARMRDMREYFSYFNRHDELMACARDVKAAMIRIQLDVNETRMSAKHGLLHSICRLNKALKLFQMKNDVYWGISSTEWETCDFF